MFDQPRATENVLKVYRDKWINLLATGVYRTVIDILSTNNLRNSLIRSGKRHNLKPKSKKRYDTLQKE